MKRGEKMNNWKEQFEKEFIYGDGDREGMIPFIETEVIEKLINDIPNDMQAQTNGYQFKQQLREGWLK